MGQQIKPDTIRAEKLLRGGFEPHEIRAKLPGVSSSTISHLAGSMGLQFRRGRRGQPASKRNQQITAYRRRHSGPETAARFKISRMRVGQIVAKIAPDDVFKDFRSGNV